MSPETFQTFVDSVGFPIAIVAVTGFGLWRVFKWLGPRIESLFTAHLRLVEDLRTTNAEANNEILRVATEILARLKQ